MMSWLPFLVGLVVGALLAPAVWLIRCLVQRHNPSRHPDHILRALFNATPDGVWVKDTQGRFIDCNETAAGFLGFNRNAVLGRTVTDLLDAPLAGQLNAQDKDVLRNDRKYIHPVQITVDEQLRRFELVKVPLLARRDGIDGILGLSRDITERQEAETQAQIWAHAFRHVQLAIAIFDSATHRIIAANPVFAQKRGYSPEEMVGVFARDLFPPELAEQRATMRHLIDQHKHTVQESVHITRDGQRFPVLLDYSVTHDNQGRPEHTVVYAQDISEHKRAEAELRLAAAAFEVQTAMLVTDANRIIQRVNTAFTTLTGYTTDEVIGQPASIFNSRQQTRETPRAIWTQVLRTGQWRGEQWIQGKHGKPKITRTMISSVTGDGGKTTHYVCSMVDITNEHEAYASINRLTFFDALTDLPNRNFLYNHIEQLLGGSTQLHSALFLIDLDNFKQINDLHDHSTGDHLLTMIAHRLRKHLDDDSILCRLSGGSFALLKTFHGIDRDVPVDRHASPHAENIRKRLQTPFPQGDHPPITITASIGWTELKPQTDTPGSVLKEAELAMYEAKSAGRDRVYRYNDAMQTRLAKHDALIHDLRRAIADSSLSLHLQGQVDTDGRTIGAEALLRWTRPNGESVSPAVFIPIAEDNGLILALGNWVLRRACTMLTKWADHAHTRDLSLAINVSAIQFAQSNFVEIVQQVLRDSGANPARLKLEITETAILDNLEEASMRLRQLRDLGILISMDDFGTGYSSLAYISRLPLDQIKIDQSFVNRLPDDPNDAMVTQTIINMGHGLNLEVIAEGVETQQQRECLAGQGCDAFQGFLFARPQPRAVFEAELEEQAGQA